MSFVLRALPLLKAIPSYYKLIGLLVAVAAISASLFGAGFKVATWKAGAESAGVLQAHTKTLTDLDKAHAAELLRRDNYARDLEDAIVQANQSVLLAAAQANAAEVSRAQAQRHAADLAAFSKSRMDKLEIAFTSATSCADVLGQYWELR